MDVENTEQQTIEPTDAGTGDVTRDDLIAAVREVGGTGSVDVEAEAAAAADRAQAGERQTAESPMEDPDEARIAALLKAREKAHAEREAAKNQAEEMLAQARAESERLLKEAREKAEREWQAEIEKKRQAFLSSPTEIARTLAGNPQEFTDAILRDGSPEGRAIAKLQQELAETKQKASTAEDVKKQLEDFRRQQELEKQQAAIEQLKTQFLGEYANAEKAPHLHARFEPDEIFARADSLARQWRQGGLKLVPPGSPKGETDFDFDDVVKYLEGESKKRIGSLLKTNPAHQVSAGAAAGQPGSAPKVQANGPRTLSAASGSERRTSPKPLSEMTGAEARQALIDEVAAARRNNPDAVF